MQSRFVYRLPDIMLPLDFPDDFETLPEGLLAVGGNLLPETLIHAYAKGIFPWFNRSDPILWWHPDPRLVLFPEKIHVSAKMRKFLRQVQKSAAYQITVNQAFTQVIQECANKRGKGRRGTWLLPKMQKNYIQLFEDGYAQSVEVWNEKKELVGGMYGVSIGKAFFGESMFSHEDNTSKMALIHLCELLQKKGYLVLDCQVSSEHLLSMGAEEISREEFLRILKKAGTATLKRGIRLNQ